MEGAYASDVIDDTVATGVRAASAGAAQGRLHSGTVSMVTSVEGLWRLEAGWRKLERTGLGAHGVFQCFDWVMSWARAYVEARGQRELCVLAGHRGEDLVFVLPLMCEQRGPVRVLRWLSEPLAQYGDVLLAPGENLEQWGGEALSLLRRLRHIDTIRLRHVRADATVRPLIARHFRDARHGDRAPWLDLAAFPTPASYEARYSPTQRKRRKKIRKALEAAFGPLQFEVLPPGARRDAAIAEAIAEKCGWLDERGRHNGVLCQRQLLGFLKDAARSANGPTQLVVSEMSAGGKALSWEIGLRLGDRHFAYVTSHVNALTDYSPARLHMEFSQRQALADNMAAFDLMVPNDAYKASWSTGSVETHDYHLPLTAMGWLYGRVYLELLRPVIRAAYYRLPPRVLRFLKRIIGH